MHGLVLAGQTRPRGLHRHLGVLRRLDGAAVEGAEKEAEAPEAEKEAEEQSDDSEENKEDE